MTAAKRPTVSVVLVTYNRASVLSRTVDSVLRQTFSDFELIITDDCSTDHTKALAKAYESRDNRVRYRCNDRNLGMPGNLNAGIRSARGEFIANLHDGDIYDPRLLELWHSALESCPKSGFVFNPYRQLRSDGTTLRIYARDLASCMTGGEFLEKQFFRAWRFDSPVWGTVMCRRSAYDEVGLFDPKFGFCSDVDMWLRLASAYNVAYVDVPVISLASKDELPASNPEPFWQQRRLLYEMFKAARRRHFKQRPMRLSYEMGKHYGFTALYRCYHVALAARRRGTTWRRSRAM